VAEWDEKLNALLSDPDSMAQILQLAQSLSGKSAGEVPPPAPPQPARNAGAPPPPKDAGDKAPPLSSLLGGLDPGLAVRLLPALRELSGPQDSDAVRLLGALRPYLRPERQSKVEQAIHLARLIRVGKKLFAAWGTEHV
jgi:hypothetical protein